MPKIRRIIDIDFSDFDSAYLFEADGDLILGVMEDSSSRQVVLTMDGAQQLHDALTGWLEIRKVSA